MPDAVTLPFWLAAALAVLAAVAIVDRLLTPSVRWLLRRRVERVLDEVHTRLQIRIQPFKLNRRQVKPIQPFKLSGACGRPKLKNASCF